MTPAAPSLIIVGGGLAGGLAALALARWQPEVSVTLVEAGTAIGGNHVWSFFDADLAGRERELVEPLVVHRWPAYDVRFPRFERVLEEGYNSVESEGLDRAVRAALPHERIVAGEATAIGPGEVRLADGRRLTAEAVLDARGFVEAPGLILGWQKFVGQLLSLNCPHGVTRPTVMDARVDQRDGYRFVYLLPFGQRRLFVEDTYYQDRPDLDRETLSKRIETYARDRKWQIERIDREEAGVLPVVLGGDLETYWPRADPVARAGVRGAFFHPLTSYSLPAAARFAHWLATEAPIGPPLAAATRRRAEEHWRRGGFDRLLARMLMRAAAPGERYRVLERFYTLPAPLIARFYAGRSTIGDRVRILAGRPPVSIRRAIGALWRQS